MPLVLTPAPLEALPYVCPMPFLSEATFLPVRTVYCVQTLKALCCPSQIYNPHMESYPWAVYLKAYNLTGYAPFKEKVGSLSFIEIRFCSMYHGFCSMYHGFCSMYHGFCLRYHGFCSMYHGFCLRYHDFRSRYHGRSQCTSTPSKT
jgi:hypothetical protein